MTDPLGGLVALDLCGAGIAACAITICGNRPRTSLWLAWLLALTSAVMVAQAVRHSSATGAPALPYLAVYGGFYLVLFGVVTANHGDGRSRRTQRSWEFWMQCWIASILVSIGCRLGDAALHSLGITMGRVAHLCLAAAVAVTVARRLTRLIRIRRYYRALDPLWNKVVSEVPSLKQQGRAVDDVGQALHFRVVALLDAQRLLRAYAPPSLREAAGAAYRNAKDPTTLQLLASAELAAGINARRAGQPRTAVPPMMPLAPDADTMAVARWFIGVSRRLRLVAVT